MGLWHSYLLDNPAGAVPRCIPGVHKISCSVPCRARVEGSERVMGRSVSDRPNRPADVCHLSLCLVVPRVKRNETATPPLVRSFEFGRLLVHANRTQQQTLETKEVILYHHHHREDTE